MRIDKILVGTDFSEDSGVAWEHARKLAAHTGAEVLLLHACEGVNGDGEGVDCPHGAVERLRGYPTRGLGAERVIQKVVHAFPDAGIIETAADFGADIVVVGTHGITAFKRLLLGSVAEKVIRSAETNVFVARERASGAGGYNTIVVPTDFSGAAERALDAALQLVAPSGRIDVLHVWQPGARDDGRDRSVQRAELMGRQLLDRHRTSDATTRFVHLEDSPARGIHRWIGGGDYDLVVMGSHGRHGLRRLVLGSVAEATVRHAPCSVLVVRAESAG